MSPAPSQSPTARPAITRERVHLVGIGGIGISAIARILLAWGTRISGSDLKLNQVTDDLRVLGARITQGHHPDNVGDATLVVISSAIPENNPEVRYARHMGIPVRKRADIIGEMMEGKHGIAVAGTHGKTTTTALIAHLFTAAGLDPTFIVGGILSGMGTNARAGQGEHFVIEADEYDGMFLGLRPRTAVVTHLEMDHPDCYPTLEDMRGAFRSFLRLVPPDGSIIASLDEPNVRNLMAEFRGPSSPQVLGYRVEGEAAWHAADIRANSKGGNDFRILREGSPWGGLSLAIPGAHNMKNALAAVCVGHLVGLSAAVICESLSTFRGVKRRFEVKGELGSVTVIDDYAHHPTKVRATLAAARERFGERKIWAVFQPHTFSRTQALFEEFASAFDEADNVLITPIFAARERDTGAIQSDLLVAAMRQRAPDRDIRYCQSLDDAVAILRDQLGGQDVLITMGAGDGFTVGERILGITSSEP